MKEKNVLKRTQIIKKKMSLGSLTSWILKYNSACLFLIPDNQYSLYALATNQQT